jgi:hypothetical protein
MAQEPSSDYGYDLVHVDLVHEETARREGREQHGDRPPEAPPRSAQRPPEEAAGDYGYDEAHDF